MHISCLQLHLFTIYNIFQNKEEVFELHLATTYFSGWGADNRSEKLTADIRGFVSPWPEWDRNIYGFPGFSFR